MKEEQLKNALLEALEIASDAILLANQYAGGDSENANELASKLLKLESGIR